MTNPFFSVAIPTFRRPQLLRQAIDSVLAQSDQDFEIVVSDDEEPEGEIWALLASLARQDDRIRPVRNPAPHGQVPNTNNAIRAATGQWVKLLHDDDALYPNCLAEFRSALATLPADHHVILASCRSDDLRLDGTVRRWQRKPAQPAAEILPQRYAALAMYLHEDVGSSLPTCLCINRGLLAACDAWMPKHAEFASSVDSHWAVVLGSAGDKLILNAALVLKREEPISVTGALTDKALDRETEILREIQRAAIPPDLRAPPLHVAQQAHRLRRAAHRLIKRRKPLEAAQLVVRCWDPRAWWLFLATAFSGRGPFPGRRTPRFSLAEMAARQAAAALNAPA